MLVDTFNKGERKMTKSEYQVMKELIEIAIAEGNDYKAKCLMVKVDRALNDEVSDS